MGIRATFDGIKLFEVVDPQLGNSNLFIPIRYVEPEIKAFSFKVVHRTVGPMSIPQDILRWRFHVGDEIIDANQLVRYAWNKNMIPQEAGRHVANFNAMTMSDTHNPDVVQYCEISISIDVIENYYLRLMPASFLKSSEDGKEHFNLRVDIRSKKTDMLRIGWKKFDSFEKMNKAADIKNQPKGVSGILLKPSYTIDSRQAKNSKK